jgi:hypothetical protein
MGHDLGETGSMKLPRAFPIRASGLNLPPPGHLIDFFFGGRNAAGARPLHGSARRTMTPDTLCTLRGRKFI